jgi:hypothetical protein
MGRSMRIGGRKFRMWAGTRTGMVMGCLASVSGDREAGDLGGEGRGSLRCPGSHCLLVGPPLILIHRSFLSGISSSTCKISSARAAGA